MNAFRKDSLRNIKKTMGRFMSILLIVAIGTGFYAGFRTTGTDMRLTADYYYRESSLMDLMIRCNFGFDDEDVKLLSAAEGVLNVSPSISQDVFDKSAGTNIRMMGLFDPEKGMNRPTLVEGRLPEKSGEIAVDSTGTVGDEYAVGDTLEIDLKDEDVADYFNKTKYTVVGKVNSPLYIGADRGTSSIGSGMSDGFMLVLPADFKSTTYPEVYLQFDLPEEATVFTPEYDQQIKDRTLALNDVLERNKEPRFYRLTAGPQTIIAGHQAEMDAANQVFAQSNTAYEAAQTDLEAAQALASVDESAVAKIQGEYDTLNAQVGTDLADYNKAVAAIGNLPGEIVTLDTTIATTGEELRADRKYLETVTIMKQAQGIDPDSDSVVIAAREALAAKEATLAELTTEVANKRSEVAKSQVTVDRLAPTIAPAKAKLDELEKKLNESTAALGSKDSLIKDAQTRMAEAQTNRDGAKAKVDELNVLVAEAKTELERLGKVNYYTFGRNLNPSYQEYGLNASRIDVIAMVFPFFFILVAALICLNTMTRMVEEETTLIGTYKALGYDDKAILAKYMGYAFFATVIGAVVGLAVGFKLLPYAIMLSYGVLYHLSTPVTVIRLDYAAVILVAALICTLVPTLFAARKQLKLVPAALMRPKTPKTGKRNWLERTPVWKLLGFSTKVTIRNLFRYKQRMLMTILGIAGGTALMLAGLGFRNALADVVNIQFNEIFHYGMIVSLDENADQVQRLKLDALLKISASDSVYTYQKTVDASNSDRSKLVAAELVVGQQANQESFPDFVTLRDRLTGDPIVFDQNSVVITEKLADLLGMKVGDQMTLTAQGSEYTAAITNITENYAGHYIYMGESIYSMYFGSVPNYTSVMLKTEYTSEEDTRMVAEAVNRMEFVRECNLTSTQKLTYANIVSGLNIIVYVFISCAALLAFVVLYNLTIINISERFRELSTFKVLGFSNREVSGFVGAENLILTVVGIAIGLGAGVYLCRYIVLAAEMNDVMFGRSIENLSYLISIVAIGFFAVLVSLLLAPKIRKINMVEALKSVE